MAKVDNRKCGECYHYIKLCDRFVCAVWGCNVKADEPAGALSMFSLN